MKHTFVRNVARGYTIVELMMSLSVLAIGVSGVIAMQKVTVATNRNAKELAIATRVAEAWADQLTADATTWELDSNGNSTRGQTIWLVSADPTQTIDWFVPNYSATRGFGAAFDAFGNPINPTTTPALGYFCAHIRFAFLHSETAPTGGNGVIRAQVRVFWPREDVTTTLPAAVINNLCSVDRPTFDSNVGAFHVVYLSTAVRETAQGLL